MPRQPDNDSEQSDDSKVIEFDSATPSAKRKPGRKAGNRRSELLDIAARVISENGFVGTTMSQISEEAGILSGSLYHHFSTKEQILHELLQPFCERFLERHKAIALSPGPAVETLRKILHCAFVELRYEHVLHSILYNERKFIRRVPEFHYLADYGVENNRILYGILMQGIREGSIRDDVNINLATSSILRLTNVLADSYEPNGRFEIEEIIDFELTLILDGLIPRK